MTNDTERTVTRSWTDTARYKAIIAIVLVLAASVVGVLALQTWRTASAHRAAAERVLTDYASFAVWSFSSRVRSTLYQASDPIFSGADRVPQQIQPVLKGMRDAADSISACRCGYDLDPRFIFLIDFQSGRAAFDVRDSALSVPAVSARVEEIRKSVAASLPRGVESRQPGTLPYRMVARTTGNESWNAVYAVRFRSAEDPGVIVGFEMTASRISQAVLQPVFRNAPLLPQSLTRSAPPDSVLSVAVRNRSGTIVYRTSREFPETFRASESLADPGSEMTAIVSMNPLAGPGLLIGGLPASPMPVVLSLVTVAVALLVLAFYLISRREFAALELRASLSEAQLAALRAQIQPHFLFNVLNSIAMLARKGDSAKVASTLTKLSDLLRALLRDPPRNEVSLLEEMTFVRRYLELEQIRFDDRLTVSMDSPPELDTARVPALILQPFVENALVHGVGGQGGKVSVSVTASQNNGSLRLEVRDSGPGFKEGAPRIGSGGIGIRNSRERLAHMYGDAAKLDVSSRPEGGVVVVVTIPLKKQMGI